MLSTALLLAASMVGQADANTTGFALLKEWASAFTGEFTYETTTNFAIEGVCEKGDKYENCSSTEWIQEDVALVKKTDHKVKGKTVASGVALIGWDAVKGAIVTTYMDSLGARLNGTITKKGDQWITRFEGTLGDGRKVQTTEVVSIGNGGKTYKYRSSSRVGEDEMPETKGELKRSTGDKPSDKGQASARKGQSGDLSKWERLREGMTVDEANQLLGETAKEHALFMGFAEGVYPSGGKVDFDHESRRIYHWSPP